MSTLLRRYRAERLPLGLLATVAPLLAVAARVGDGAPGFSMLLSDVTLALLLFTQFRILDDVADRRHDARVHPERVLVRAASVAPIAAAGLVLAAGTITLLVVRASRAGRPVVITGAIVQPIGVFLLIIAALWTWYSARRGRTLGGDHLLLAKYPAFVWIIAASRGGAAPFSGRLALSMLATYLAACVYEALHDQDSPATARPALVAAESVALALTLAALSIRGPV